MCNLHVWLPDVNAGSCGAEAASACVIEEVLTLLLGGTPGGARFSPASGALIC